MASNIWSLTPPVWPGDGRWFFNPFAWQLLFACGLAIGKAIDEGRPPVANRVLDILAPVYLVACLGWVLAGFPFSLEFWSLPDFIWSFEKTTLALPRLLHVLALVYCVSRLPLENWLRRTAAALPLIQMGRHSLPVFCVGTVLSLAAQAVRPGFDGAFAFDLVILSLGFSIQWLVAWTLEWQRSGRKSKAVVQTPAVASPGTVTPGVPAR